MESCNKHEKLKTFLQERSKSWENNVKKAKHEFFGIYSNCTTLFKSLYIGDITIYQRKVIHAIHIFHNARSGLVIAELH